jgi:hypothetical protein
MPGVLLYMLTNLLITNEINKAFLVNGKHTILRISTGRLVVVLVQIQSRTKPVFLNLY